MNNVSTQGVFCILLSMLVWHVSALPMHQCDITAQCRTIVDGSATGCRDSGSEHRMRTGGACAQARLTSPNTLNAGSNATVSVDSNPAEDVVSVVVNIDDQAVRTERQTPYTRSGSQVDVVLQILAASTYQPLTELTHTIGLKGGGTQTLTLSSISGARFMSPNKLTAVSAFMIEMLLKAIAGDPFHRRMGGDVNGQYFTDSSIHRSYSRCVAPHGSHNTLVKDKVWSKHPAHGYFLEDGYEAGKVFDVNIAIRAYRPAANVALLTRGRMGDPSSANSTADFRGFWISNPDNAFISNVALGSDGKGFSFHTKDRVVGTSLGASPESRSVSLRAALLGKFDANLVHSSMMGVSLYNRRIHFVSTWVPINAPGSKRELSYIPTSDTRRKEDRQRFDIGKEKPGREYISYFIIRDVPATLRFTGSTTQQINSVASVASVRSTANSWYRNGSEPYASIQLKGADWA